jgi:hypothetical protein
MVMQSQNIKYTSLMHVDVNSSGMTIKIMKKKEEKGRKIYK